jgi:hypothetical protein
MGLYDAGIENEDSEYLLSVFTRAKDVRDKFTANLSKKDTNKT